MNKQLLPTIAALLAFHIAFTQADENPPESWFALMHFAKQRLNKPVDLNAPAIKQVRADQECDRQREELEGVRSRESSRNAAQYAG